MSTRLAGAAVAAAVAFSALAAPAAPAAGATFDPDNVICDSAFKDHRSMSRGDIQSFLDAMPGILKTYRARDHRGVTKPASQIIYEAARAWRINPKVILTMLQKEQGLLTLEHPDAERIREAMGCGIYKGTTNTYAGFGNQVWNGTRKLAQYPRLFPWHPGAHKRVYGNHYVTPDNLSTWCLYVYNPSIGGNKVFWTVYWRYFGDTQRRSWQRPVYAFRYQWNSRRVYTTSEGQRYRWMAEWGPMSREATDRLAPVQGGAYVSEGTAFTVSTRSADNTAPVYRVLDTSTNGYVYTTSGTERSALLADASGRYSDSGVAFYVTLDPAHGAPVYKVVDTVLGAYVYVASTAQRDALLAEPFARYADGGVGFYLAP
jgi:hypothetical protein